MKLGLSVIESGLNMSVSVLDPEKYMLNWIHPSGCWAAPVDILLIIITSINISRTFEEQSKEGKSKNEPFG